MQRTPYQLAAVDYAKAGWSPIPLPFREKSPVPDGVTGAKGRWISVEQAENWSLDRARVKAGKLHFPPSNIALRLPKNVIGIDIDMYGTKAGRETLRRAEEKWGKLPPTWITTSKRDGSGIRLYLVPEGLAWPESLRGTEIGGGGVEIIRWDHRYAIVSPSRHPSGDVYRWILPSGDIAIGEFPAVDELRELSEEWIDGLTKGRRKWRERKEDDLDAGEVKAWLDARVGGQPCAEMEKTLVRFSRLLRTAGDDGGAHDIARDGAWALIGDAARGHSGVKKALAALRKVFLAAVEDRREGDAAKSEWRRIVTRGVAKVSAEGEPETEDICALIAGSGEAVPAPGGGGRDGTGGRGARTGSSAFDYTRDDIGNAQRLVNRVGDDIRYCEALGGWLTWDGRHWVRNGEVVLRHAMETVRAMENEAEFIEDSKAKLEFLRFVRSSGNIGRIRAMIEIAKNLNRIAVPAASFNAHKGAIVCPNGTVELSAKTGVRFRPSRREDYSTEITGAAYEKESSGGGWAEFLMSALPEKEIRDWVQRLVGYSLYGANPHRLLIALYGPTSTGKTTFAEVLKAALGSYAGATTLSIFRDNLDERPRADLVNALSKRIIFAEEASGSSYLHADQIKRMTGGATVLARMPYAREYIEATPAFTPWMLVNTPPRIEEADEAVLRRLVVVPFSRVVEKGQENARLAEELANEETLAEVLSWAIEGWRRYVEAGGGKANEALTRPPTESARRAREEFTAELSALEGFMAECLEYADGETVPARDVYAVYEMWCDLNGIDQRNRVSALRLGKFLTGRRIGRKVIRDGRNVLKVRTGVRLKSGWKPR